MSAPNDPMIRSTGRDTVVLRRGARGKQPEAPAANERRAPKREPPAAGRTVTFAYQEKTYQGRVVDQSERGLGLRLNAFEGNLYLVPGTALTIAVADADGVVEQRFRVAWARIRDGAYCLGVERFIDAGPPPPQLLNLDLVTIDPALALLVPPALALRKQLLPFGVRDGVVHLACASPPDTAAVQAIERAVQRPVHAELVEPESLKRALNRVYGGPQSALTAAVQARGRSVDVRALGDLEPDDAVALGEELLHAAVLRQASDIHIDPERNEVRVRFRVDGVLEVHRRLPAAAHAGLTSRLKVLCNMDIAEKRAPQDGGFKYTYGPTGQAVDIRAATLPTKFGERMTLRLLALQKETLTLERLGMCQRDLACFEQMLDKPHGMILLTGPTGSGKSTTLYASIRWLIERESLNVVTIEDPIEYEIDSVAQVEIDSADKVSFSKALRSVLRHDPDVVMIGEIRDAETAGIAIKAALTGHLVFSTLHTNTAVGVVTRLADMGIARYLIGASMRLAVAQRLVRRLCAHCRRPHVLTEPEAAALGRPELVGLEVFGPGGCLYCGERGYQGRVGLFELFPLNESLARRVADNAEEPELLAYMREHKLATLMDDAVDKLRAGLTSVREVLTAVTVW